MPYMALTYANGPGHTYHTTNEGRLNLTGMSITDYKFVHPAAVPLVVLVKCIIRKLLTNCFTQASETHAADDVGIFASGPWAKLFTGVLEQNVIPHFMAYAACIGTGLTACD